MSKKLIVSAWLWLPFATLSIIYQKTSLLFVRWVKLFNEQINFNFSSFINDILDFFWDVRVYNVFTHSYGSLRNRSVGVWFQRQKEKCVYFEQNLSIRRLTFSFLSYSLFFSHNTNNYGWILLPDMWRQKLVIFSSSLHQNDGKDLIESIHQRHPRAISSTRTMIWKITYILQMNVLHILSSHMLIRSWLWSNSFRRSFLTCSFRFVTTYYFSFSRTSLMNRHLVNHNTTSIYTITPMYINSWLSTSIDPGNQIDVLLLYSDWQNSLK